MKALSIRQPWVFAICELGKVIENRSWYTRYRGPLAIHASKGMEAEELAGFLDYVRRTLALGDAQVDDLRRRFRVADRRGGIVAVCDLVDVLSPCRGACGHAWHTPESFGFVLANVRRTPFVALPGERGLFEVSPANEERLGL